MNWKNFLWAGLLLTLVFIQYAPSLVIPHASHDQYRFFREDFGHQNFKNHCYNDIQNETIRILGRHLAAKWECTIFENVETVSDLTFFRFFVLSIAALYGLLLFYGLYRASGSRLFSLILAASITYLPGTQNAIHMTFFQNIITPFLSFLAGLIILYFFEHKKWLKYLLAFLCLGIAFVHYTTMTLLFFVPFLIQYLFNNSKAFVENIKPALNFYIFYAICAGLFYKFGRYKYLRLSEEQRNRLEGPYKVELTIEQLMSHFSGKIESLYKATKLWVINDFNWFHDIFQVSLVLALVIGLCYWSWSFKSHRDRALALLGAFLCLLTFSTFFIIKGGIHMHRLALPLSTAYLVIVGSIAFQFLKSHDKLYRYAFGAIAFLFAFITSFQNNLINVQNSWSELTFIKHELSKIEDSDLPETIELVLPVGTPVGFNGIPHLYDEFNISTASYFTGFAPYMVRVALKEMGKNTKYVLTTGNQYPESVERSQVIQITPLQPGQAKLPMAAGAFRIDFVKGICSKIYFIKPMRKYTSIDNYCRDNLFF